MLWAACFALLSSVSFSLSWVSVVSVRVCMAVISFLIVVILWFACILFLAVALGMWYCWRSCVCVSGFPIMISCKCRYTCVMSCAMVSSSLVGMGVCLCRISLLCAVMSRICASSAVGMLGI